MQDKNNSQNNASVVENSAGKGADSAGAATTAVNRAAQGDFIQKIIEKIKSSENILIALSRDPSVDEIAAAIGLTMFLDGMQKHATAIYSGRTPDTVAFLQPNETFEKNTDSLQDFIIALNKDKADHLRYKLEGDFVKVFVTPYKAKITQEDLQFSYGDFNVDFVIAINVASAGNLDEALREHGRIMHDAAVVNITTGEPGRFGEIEWSSPVASSLCEMVTELIFTMQNPDEKPLERDIATALLTGIVAATDRFSNNRTNSDTMGVASKLMSMGADQQLISSNVSGNDVVHNEPGGMVDGPLADAAAAAAEKKTNLTIEHDVPEGGSEANAAAGGAAVNPAVQAAPSVSADGNASTSGMVSATNDVTPENVVVQPVIPGKNGVPVDQMVIPGVSSSANNGSEIGGAANVAPVNGVQGNTTAASQAQANAAPVAGAQANTAVAGQVQAGVVSMPVAQTNVVPTVQANVVPTPITNPGQMQIPGAGGSNGAVNDAVAGAMPPRPMATSAPEVPAVKQVGSTLQPPVTEKKKPKNYAEMMEEALSEGVPQYDANNADGANLGVDTTMNLPGAQGSGMVDVGAASTMAVPGANTGAVPAMEPVANPMGGAILPPPPAPIDSSNGVIPVLPPVQM